MFQLISPDYRLSLTLSQIERGEVFHPPYNNSPILYTLLGKTPRELKEGNDPLQRITLELSCLDTSGVPAITRDPLTLPWQDVERDHLYAIRQEGFIHPDLIEKGLVVRMKDNPTFFVVDEVKCNGDRHSHKHEVKLHVLDEPSRSIEMVIDLEAAKVEDWRAYLTNEQILQLRKLVEHVTSRKVIDFPVGGEPLLGKSKKNEGDFPFPEHLIGVIQSFLEGKGPKDSKNVQVFVADLLPTTEDITTPPVKPPVLNRSQPADGLPEDVKERRVYPRDVSSWANSFAIGNAGLFEEGRFNALKAEYGNILYLLHKNVPYGDAINLLESLDKILENLYEPEEDTTPSAPTLSASQKDAADKAEMARTHEQPQDDDYVPTVQLPVPNPFKNSEFTAEVGSDRIKVKGTQWEFSFPKNSLPEIKATLPLKGNQDFQTVVQGLGFNLNLSTAYLSAFHSQWTQTPEKLQTFLEGELSVEEALLISNALFNPQKEGSQLLVSPLGRIYGGGQPSGKKVWIKPLPSGLHLMVIEMGDRKHFFGLHFIQIPMYLKVINLGEFKWIGGE